MQTIKLNLIPGSVLPVVNASQYDAHRQFALQVYEGATAYNLTGKTVEIRGTKPDGNGFAYDAQDGVVSVSNNVVTISTTQQMTAVGGQTMVELRITSGSTVLGTLNFVLDVEHSALSDDTPISETDIPAIERDMQAAVDQAEAAAQTATTKAGEASASATRAANSATTATGAATTATTQAGIATTKAGEAFTSATNAATSAGNASDSADAASGSAQAASDSADDAADSAEDSEAYANGTRGGSDVPSTDPTYHNNAKYWRDQAASYAAGGIHFMGSIPFSDIPTVGMANGDEYNITNDFVTDSRFVEGAGVSVEAGSDIAWVGGNTNKWNVLATGGGGNNDYSPLINKPRINNVELNGNKTPAELGLATNAAMTGATAGTAGAKGLVPAPAAGDQDKVLCGDGTWKTPSGGSDMTGATASTPGTHGLVPAPAAGDDTKFLRGDGTWAEAGGGGGGFDYKAWLQAASINPAGYADLAAVLADDETVRHLMTLHLSVDYLTGFGVGDTNIQTILNNDFAAKWINLRDYALDKLEYAFSALMASIDKYGYGEWTKLSESPETWGPKGNVPIMTSNTAPYGTAIANSEYSSARGAFAAFDGSDSGGWNAASGTKSNAYVGYHFTNPVIVRRIMIIPDNTGATSFDRVKDFEVKGSNDGSTWTTIYTGTAQNTSTAQPQYFDINNDTPYLYCIINVINVYSGATVIGIRTLQFYGRELKVSVPVMTSNTAPYGVASASSERGSSYAAFAAFDGTISSSNNWDAGTSAASWICYDFGYPVIVKQIALYNYQASQGYTCRYFQPQGSNDGSTWENIGEKITASQVSSWVIYDLDNDIPYKKIRIAVDALTTSNYVAIAGLQFYGFDYSEYDWDTVNPRHYLYDHGVELETITTSGTVTKGTDAITLSAANAQATNTVDLTSYNLLRGAVGQHFSGTTQLIARTTATANMTAANAPYNESLDISNVSASLATGAKMTSVGVCDITEMWLE